MSLARHRIDIELDLMTRLAIAIPGIGQTGENSDFTPPQTSSWVRISVEDAVVQYRYLGLSQKTTNGILSVQVFTPRATGSGAAATISDAIVDLLKSSALTAIEFLDFSITPSPSITNGWYMNVVRANYIAHD